MPASPTPARGRRPAPAAPGIARIARIALVALIALAACGPAPAPPARYEQTVDGLTIALEAAASPRLNASERLLVTLTDAQGQPVDGADVYVDLDMPAMPMGTNRPIAEPQGEGRYLASTAYTMVGEWELTVVAEVGGREHRAVFAITAVE